MSQADSNNSTRAPIDPSRRRFLTVAAAASAVSVGALTAAAMPASQAPDDSRLVELEEQIFELQEKASAFDDEIIRVSDIWQGEYKRRLDEQSDLTPAQCWSAIKDLPASKEHTRLVELQDPFYEKMDDLIEEMFATPAKTSEGRRAKAIVLISIIMPSDWQKADEETDYPERTMRSLLIEFIGGEPGEELRSQFASAASA